MEKYYVDEWNVAKYNFNFILMVWTLNKIKSKFFYCYFATYLYLFILKIELKSYNYLIKFKKLYKVRFFQVLANSLQEEGCSLSHLILWEWQITIEKEKEKGKVESNSTASSL